MDVVVEISDPWELTQDDGPTILRGRSTSSVTALGDELELSTPLPQCLGGKAVQRFVIRRRHVGSSFTELLSSEGLSVNGRAYIAGTNDALRFIGVARALNYNET